MNNLTGMFNGVKIIKQEPAKVPNRQHQKKDWMSDNYHKRIQKKWNKRFGFHYCHYMEKGQMLQYGNTVVCRSDEYDEVLRRLNAI